SSVLGVMVATGLWLGSRSATTPSPSKAPAGTDVGVIVESTPPSAEVLVDGTLITGTTPLRVLGWTVGAPHRLTVFRSGFKPTILDVSLDRPEIKTVPAVLAAEPEPKIVRKAQAPATQKPSPAPRAIPAPPVETGTGKLRIIVNPWGSVSIDGK